MTKTKPQLVHDGAAKCRAALAFYALTPSKKYPLPTKIQDGKLVFVKRRTEEWAQYFGQSRSYLIKLLNNTNGFVLKNPRPFAEIVAGVLSEIAGTKVKPEDVWELDD